MKEFSIFEFSINQNHQESVSGVIEMDKSETFSINQNHQESVSQGANRIKST